jgi:hypothetical protein
MCLDPGIMTLALLKPLEAGFKGLCTCETALVTFIRPSTEDLAMGPRLERPQVWLGRPLRPWRFGSLLNAHDNMDVYAFRAQHKRSASASFDIIGVVEKAYRHRTATEHKHIPKFQRF